MSAADESNAPATCNRCGQPAACMRLLRAGSINEFPEWEWFCNGCCGHMADPEDAPCIPADAVPAYYSQVDHTASVQRAEFDEAIGILKRKTGVDFTDIIDDTVRRGFKTMTCPTCHGRGWTRGVWFGLKRRCRTCHGVGTYTVPL